MRLEYKNRAELEVSACGQTHIIYSNEVEAKKIAVRVEKFESKCCVFKGDHLKYIVKICNDSLVDLECATFCDDIPEGLKYVPNSFKVDGRHEKAQQDCDNRISYKLDELKAGCEATITFDTIVL